MGYVWQLIMLGHWILEWEKCLRLTPKYLKKVMKHFTILINILCFTLKSWKLWFPEYKKWKVQLKAIFYWFGCSFLIAFAMSWTWSDAIWTCLTLGQTDRVSFLDFSQIHILTFFFFFTETYKASSFIMLGYYWWLCCFCEWRFSPCVVSQDWFRWRVLAWT